MEKRARLNLPQAVAVSIPINSDLACEQREQPFYESSTTQTLASPSQVNLGLVQSCEQPVAVPACTTLPKSSTFQNLSWKANIQQPPVPISDTIQNFISAPAKTESIKEVATRLTSLSNKPTYSMELCCGCANLSKKLQSKGFTPLAVDYDRNPHAKPFVKVILADLSSPEGQATVMNLHDDLLPAILHAAPPCGTASKARERRIPAWLRAQGAPYLLSIFGVSTWLARLNRH